jgi:hypothetical protein
MSRSRLAHRLLLSVLALLLAGCGVDDASRGPTTTVSAPAQTETQTSDGLDESEDDGGEDDGVGYGNERGKDHGKDKGKGKKLGHDKKD